MGTKERPPIISLASLPFHSSFFSCFLQKICFEHYPLFTMLGTGNPELKGRVSVLRLLPEWQWTLITTAGLGLHEGLDMPRRRKVSSALGHCDDLRKMPSS